MLRKTIVAFIFVGAALAKPDYKELSKQMFAAMDADSDKHLSRTEIDGILTSPPAKAKGIERAPPARAGPVFGVLA